VRLWIDTDVGDDPDDVVALACAQAHADVEIVGVSVVGGHTGERAELARRYVDAPVHEPDESLEAGLRAARPEALLAIGPLTNVPRLVEAGPGIPLTLMGGVVVPLHHRGARRTVEHNLGADPGAARAVFGATEAVVVPLDVTVGMTVSGPDRRRLLTAVPGLREEVERWTAWVVETSGMDAGDVALVLHDPLALLVCAGDAAADAEIEPRTLDVDPAGRLVDGAHRHRVVLGVDATRAVARVLELVG
jgi:inosine-uridine nucleoside N-ribohydrolase